MKGHFRPLGVLLCATRASAQSAADSVRSIDSAWARSYAVHDTALALRVFAEDLIITATNGTQKDRRAELNDVREAPGVTVNFFRSKDVVVRVYGNAAVAMGLLEWELIMQGRTAPTRRRYTATYVRGGPLGWKMVALHIGQAPG